MNLRKLFIEKLGGYATADDAIKAVGAFRTAEEAIAAIGGFLTIDEAIEAIRSKGLSERHAILTLAVKKLFNTISSDDILKPGPNGSWLYEGKELSKGQRDMLMAEAHQLQSMLLWKVLKKDVFYLANKKMFLAAENEMHIITAKFWLYTFDTLATRIKSITTGSATFNSKDEKRK